MALAGCAALVVRHTHTPRGAPSAVHVDIEVPMTAAAAGRRGRAGACPCVEEVRVAAQQWLLQHAPAVLENDVEHALRLALNGNAYVLWNAPSFPELMGIEFVWAQVKAFAGAAWSGRRTLAGLAHDVHRALYTAEEAQPGVLRVRGGDFVAGAAGACPAAEAIFEHVLRNPRGGARAHIAVSSRLSGTMDDLVVPGELQAAVAARCRNVMLLLQAQLLAQGGEVELGAALEEEGEAVGEGEGEGEGEGNDGGPILMVTV